MTEKTRGQWSRPPVWLIFGVRPNSEVTMTSVLSSMPRWSRSRIRAAMAWSTGGRFFSMPALMLSWWSQPPAVRETKRDAGLDEAAGEQHALAGLACGRSRRLQLVGLGVEVERLAGLLRGDQLVGVLIEGVHRVDGVGFLEGAEMVVDGFEQRAAAVEAFLVDALGQVEVADLEIAVRRIGAEGEGAVGGGEVAGVGELVGDVGDADVGRQVVARAEFVGDHRADGRVFEGGRRAGSR